MPGNNGKEYLKKLANKRLHLSRREMPAKTLSTKGTSGGYDVNTVTSGPGSGSARGRHGGPGNQFTPMNTQGWQNQSKKAKRSGSSQGFYTTRRARGG